MSTLKICYRTFLLISIPFFLSSCDPEYQYTITGNITNATDRSPLRNLDFSYTFISNSGNNWRASFSDSTSQTDSEGNFNIQESTITFYYDSLNINIKKENFEPIEITRPLDKNNFLIEYDFGDIHLKPI